MECKKIPKDAIIHFGSGGSVAIIVILQDSAYKYFPFYRYINSTESKINRNINDSKYEINVIKLLTNKIIKKKLSPHLIKYYGNSVCKNSKILFEDCPSYKKFLLTKKYPDRKCKNLYVGHPVFLEKKLLVLKMERAYFSLEDQLKIVSLGKWNIIENFLNRILFQIFYTIETIKTIYPDFIHNDLFIRNILLNYQKNNKEDDDAYLRYNYKNLKFDVPSNGFIIKINDFGSSQLNSNLSKKYDKKHIINHSYKDYFTILYDLYDGQNLGSSSLKSLIKNKEKLKLLDNYFNNYFDVKIIKKISKNDKKNIFDRNRNQTFDKEIINLLKIKNIKKYLHNFKNIFPYKKTNNIIEEYGL